MPWRTRITTILDIVLRVPPLFAMDSVLSNFFFPSLSIGIVHYDQTSMTWTYFFQLLTLKTICFFLAFYAFLQTSRQLLDLYSYVLSLGILLVSYYWNICFILPVYTEEVEQVWPANKTLLQILRDDYWGYIHHTLVQTALAFLFSKVWDCRKASRQYGDLGRSLVYSSVNLSLMFPLLLRAAYHDFDVFLWSPTLALLIPLYVMASDMFSSLSRIFWNLKRSYTVLKLTLEAVGIQGFLENHWIRLHVPKVLRIFFISRIVLQIGYFYIVAKYDPKNMTESGEYDSSKMLHYVGYQLMVRSCDNIISLLGLTSIVSFVAHYIGTFMAFCIGSSDEEDKNMGTVSAILFFILALQTGLINLDPEPRLARLNKNLYLLCTAITHFVHSMVHPVLMSLSASRNMNVKSHARALAMCAFLITFPSCLLIYLWSIHRINTWLLAVTAFSLEVIIKVTVSLMVYTLFMLDAYRAKFWERLDDYVYYIQSTGNTIEFLFGIFLFCNGGWILLFESGGAIRAVMMCIHAYFNIWVQAKEGWKVFIKRKTAVNKINSLPLATTEQLCQVNDVCAICYQELENARITQCNHYFHGVCLRKWLYVQDNCPLCHKLIYKSQDLAESNGTEADSNRLRADDANQNNINHREQHMGGIPHREAQHIHQD